MKVVKHTGLVPVLAVRGDSRHKAGVPFGVYPEQARKGVLDGTLELVEDSKLVGVETYDVPGPPTAAPKAPVPVEPVSDVDIPKNWESLHHLQVIKLAKQIAGMAPSERLDTAGASEIIKRELARRDATPPAA